MQKVSILLFIYIVAFSKGDARDYKKNGIDTCYVIPEGLKPNQTAPGFIAKDAENKTFDLYETLQNKKVVLFFYRGSWCPVCNRYLSGLNDSLQYIQKEDVEIVAVTTEKLNEANKMSNKYGIRVIPDTDYSISKVYNVLFKVSDRYEKRIKTFLSTDIAKHNDQEEAWLPVPATYVIGKDKIIDYAHFDIDYRHRASPYEIIKALNE